MRGLLMIEPLYKQTIVGRKTMTRRSGGLDAVNGREATKTKPAIVTNPDEWSIVGKGIGLVSPQKAFDNIVDMFENREPKHSSPLIQVDFRNSTNGRSVTCKPRYNVGEVLYLKEPWYLTRGGNGVYQYKFEPEHEHNMKGVAKFKNKLFMPAAAARAYVKITGIKCERLHDISDYDCIAEGIEKFMGLDGQYVIYDKSGMFTDVPRRSFFSLYRFANKMKLSIPNIWVWCYSYEYLIDYKHG